MSQTIAYMSPEWFEIRRGKVTASKFGDILTSPKSPRESEELARVFGIEPGWSATAFAYALDIVLSKYGEPEDGSEYRSPEMQWGIDHEPAAREAYELRTFQKVTEPGFILKPGTIIGCTPDGHVGSKGGLEIKCPKSAKHIQIVMSKAIPVYWWPQIQGCLWITGRDWWDFASYDPRMPKDKKLVVIRAMRDERFISSMSLRVIAFLKMLEQLDRKVNG